MNCIVKQIVITQYNLRTIVEHQLDYEKRFTKLTSVSKDYKFLFCNGAAKRIKDLARKKGFSGTQCVLCKEVSIGPKYNEWMDYMSVFAHYLVFKKNSKYICKHCK